MDKQKVLWVGFLLVLVIITSAVVTADPCTKCTETPAFSVFDLSRSAQNPRTFTVTLNLPSASSKVPLYTKGYYRVTASGTSQWIEFPLASAFLTSSQSYTFDNPGANSKWVDIQALAGQSSTVASVTAPGTDPIDYVALFACSCTNLQQCASQEQWTCNPLTAGDKGITAGRWIVKNLAVCTNGETRLTGCDANGLNCATAEYCSNGAWVAYT